MQLASPRSVGRALGEIVGSRKLKRTLLTALAAAATLAFAASAQAAYLNVGTSNTGNATTILKGTTAGPELSVENDSGGTASAYALYGFLKPTSPTVNAAAVRDWREYGRKLRLRQTGKGCQKPAPQPGKRSASRSPRQSQARRHGKIMACRR